jgi:hypothetical protein
MEWLFHQFGRKNMSKPKSLLLAAALLSLSIITVWPAHAGVALGMLSCRNTEVSGYVFKSSRVLDCAFSPSNGGAVQYYEAVLHRYGAQFGVTRNTAMEWAVVAAGSRAESNMLTGEYEGISAGAAIGAGLAANGLVGGLGNSIALQPISFEGQNGYNLVATVTKLELSPVIPMATRHQRIRRSRQ